MCARCSVASRAEWRAWCGCDVFAGATERLMDIATHRDSCLSDLPKEICAGLTGLNHSQSR